MTQTSYVNPNGLPADGQITSARDLAILARAIIRDLPEYEYFMHIPSIRYGRRVTQNFNKLIGRYPGADGFKTGFICASGYNLVASATRNGKRLIAVVLGSSSGRMRAVRAAQLLERGFANNTLTWLRPSLGTVDNLVPIDASPPNLRDEMCGGKRKRPATDEDADTVASNGSASGGETAVTFFTAGLQAPMAKPSELMAAAPAASEPDRRLHRPEEDRRRPDRRRGRRRAKADAAAARKEVAGRGQEAGRRGRAQGRSQAGGQGNQASQIRSQNRRQAGRRQAGPRQAGRRRRNQPPPSRLRRQAAKQAAPSRLLQDCRQARGRKPTSPRPSRPSPSCCKARAQEQRRQAFGPEDRRRAAELAPHSAGQTGHF